MSWHFLQGQEAAFWEGTCLDGAPSVLLKSIPMQDRSCLPDKQMAVCPDSRSGMTSQPLTEHPGEGTSTLSQEASRAKTSVQQAREQASQESAAASGVRWRELSARYDRATSGWKTHRCLWTEALQPSSVTLPRWGMMQDGVLWERTMPEHLTGETGSGYWVTPKASETHGERYTAETAIRHWQEGRQICLSQKIKHPMMWPTPATWGFAAEGQIMGLIRNCQSIEEAQGMAGRFASRVTTRWPTPQASEARQGYQDRSRGKKGSQESLSTIVQGGKAKEVGGALNPTWVEWLMGWPLGWTSMECMQGLTWAAWQRAYQTGQRGSMP